MRSASQLTELHVFEKSENSDRDSRSLPQNFGDREQFRMAQDVHVVNGYKTICDGEHMAAV